MNPENENKIIVDIELLDRLITTETKYDVLTKAMLASAQLSFDRKSLRFDDEIICTLLKVMLGYLYEGKLEELQRECDSTTIKV